MADPDALAPIRAFTEAMNARDLEAMRASLHYPHFRLADGQMQVTELASDLPPPWEAHKDLGRGTLDSWTVLHAGADKVPFSIHVTRYNVDDEPYSDFDSLWVVTREDDHWGVKLRSSFAPSP